MRVRHKVSISLARAPLWGVLAYYKGCYLMRGLRAVGLVACLAVLGVLAGHVFDIGDQKDADRGQVQLAFAALEGKGEEIPKRLWRAVHKTLGNRFADRSPSDAHYLPTAAGDGIWVVSTVKQTCIASNKAAVACAPNAKVDRWGIAIGTGGRADPNSHLRAYFVFGIAPDWADSVQVRIVGESASIKVPIVDNTYSVKSHRPILVTRLNHR